MRFPWQYSDPNFTTRATNRTDTDAFPYMWRQEQPTMDKFLIEKLNDIEKELEQIERRLTDLEYRLTELI